MALWKRAKHFGFGFKAAAACFSETSILNNSEVYTPFSKFVSYVLRKLKCQTVFDLYVHLLSFIKVKFAGKKSFLVSAGQAEPGFRSSILLSKLVRYAFPAIWLVFGIYTIQIGRRAGILQNLHKIMVNQKCYLEIERLDQKCYLGYSER